jgi:polyhydroxyalkanoate synthase
MELAPTPKDTIFRDGTAELLHFRRPADVAPAGGAPLLLVPSMINKWYVLDLRRGSSVVEALTKAGIDTYCIDWGAPEDEDRYLSWEDVITRLGRMVRRVKRETGAAKVGVLGYCMGATLSTVHTALEPDSVAALVNLLGPVDFSKAGFLGDMVDGRFFDAQAIGAAGNMSASMMQSGFTALRPTTQIAKIVGYLDRCHDPRAREAFDALEAWSGDNVPFPGAAYTTYIGELYQKNALVKGEHYVRGRKADLKNIRCPVLSIVADRDSICPPGAATALNDNVSSADKEVLTVGGGHVGAVVGSKAAKLLYPALTAWLKARLAPRAEPRPSSVVEAQA